MKSPTSTLVSPPLSSPPGLPPYLCNTEPLEPEAIPLQLALLTMEVRTQREALQRLTAVLDMASRMSALPGINLDDG
jgi:hypothetical protein